MPKIPALTSKQIVKVLKKAGFGEDRQKGSHLVMISLKTGARTVIPMHSKKTIKKSLLRGIITDAKLSVKEFLDLL